MSIQQVFVVILCILCSSNAIYIKNDKKSIGSPDDTLIFTHVLARHGERNPREAGVYPTDPYADPSHWPTGFDKLTNRGIRESYELGEYLRQRYHSLIGKNGYSDDLIYVHATDVPRIIRSASATMAGMFPPTAEQTWSKDLKWIPVPVHTIPKPDDYVLYAETPCPRLKRITRQHRESREYKDDIGKYKKLIQYLERNSGVQIGEDYGPLHFLYDTLMIHDANNKTLPEWAQKVYGPGTEYEYASNRYFQIYTMTPELARLNYGFLLRDILDRCDQKIKGKLSPNRSLWIYYAHDTTIVSLLNMFGLFDNHHPPFSSAVLMDLYQTKDNKSYIQISYKNTTGPATVFSIPHCGKRCLLEDVRDLYKEIIPTESFDDECRLPFYLRVLEGNICGSDNCVLPFIILAIVLPMAFILAWVIWRQKYSQVLKNEKSLKIVNSDSIEIKAPEKC